MVSSTLTSLKAIETLNVDGIRLSLNYMPEGPYQTFCSWILANSEMAVDWLQLMGVTSLTRLTLGILDGLLCTDEMVALLPYTVNMTIFNMYEIVSDNLAIGLAYQQPHDTSYGQRRKILSALSRAMVARLRGVERHEAVNILAQQREVYQVSLFEQSLNPEKHRVIGNVFAQHQPAIRLGDLEYALYPNLVANIEACYQVVDTLKGYLTQELVQKGFMRRYAGLNRLLNDSFIPRDYLIQIAVNTIMVRPVLGYYIAIIAEEIRLLDNYEAICENGFLLKALEDAALLIRLLNDLGPYLLEQADEDHQDLVQRLYHAQEHERFCSFGDLLLHCTQTENVAMTRLKKDLMFGEFNLALYEPCRSQSVWEAIDVFHDQIKYLSKLYRRRAIRLRNTLDIISFETQSSIIADIIQRFIKFHENLYRVPFDHPDGEFAV